MRSRMEQGLRLSVWRPWLRLLVALILTGVLLPATRHAAASGGGSDWPMLGANPAQSNFNSREHTLYPRGLHLRWKVSGIPGPYIVAGGRVFAVTATGRTLVAIALDTRTGSRLGTYGPVRGTYLAYAGGHLYVVGAELSAFDAGTGRRLFQSHVSHSGALADMWLPVVSHGVVFALGTRFGPRTGRNDYAFDAQNGHILWSKPANDVSASCIHDGHLYYGGDPEKPRLGSYDLHTGRRLWMISEGSGGFGGILFGDHDLFFAFGTASHTVIAQALTSNGRSRWTESGFMPQAVAYGRAYGLVLGKAGVRGVAAVDAAHGKYVWINRGLHEPNDTIIANGVVYVYEGTNSIAALDARTGRLLTRLYPPHGYTLKGPLGVAGGMLFMGAIAGGGRNVGQYLLAFGQ